MDVACPTAEGAKGMRTPGILLIFSSGFLLERYDRGVEEYQSELFLVGLVREVNPTLTET